MALNLLAQALGFLQILVFDFFFVVIRILSCYTHYKIIINQRICQILKACFFLHIKPISKTKVTSRLIIAESNENDLPGFSRPVYLLRTNCSRSLSTVMSRN